MRLIRSLSPIFKARLAGLCYLFTIGTGAFDHFWVGRLIMPENAAATAQNILASEPVYRLAFALDLIPAYLIVTVLLYDLFRPVSRTLSLLAAAASFMGGAVGNVIGVFQLAPLAILRVSGTEQLQGLAMTFLRLHEFGFTISLVFFGFYCFLLGWLIVESTFMPRITGVLMAIGGLAYMAFSFADIISPPLAARLSSFALMAGSVGESVLTIWLIAAGLNTSKWRARAAA